MEGEDWFSPATVTKTSTLPVDTIGERAIWVSKLILSLSVAAPPPPQGFPPSA